MPYKDPDIKRRQNAIAERVRLKRYRSEILSLLGNECCQCGFTDLRAMNIDHKFGGGTKDRYRCGSNFYKRVLDRIRSGKHDLQLLCANCNQIKRYTHNEYRNVRKWSNTE